MGKWKNTYNESRTYRKSWEHEFKWLSWRDNACFCKCFHRWLSSMRKSAFSQHEKTAKHRKNQESFTKIKKIMDTFKERSPDPSMRYVRAVPSLTATMSTAAPEPAPGYTYDTLAITRPSQHVFQVNINRPKNLNAMNKAFWREIREVFEQLGTDSDCRAVVLAASGRVFTAGIDLSELAEMGGVVMGDDDVARKARSLTPIITGYQASFTALEKCPKPVVAAVHNACVGGGVDLICAADIRYCSDDAWFQIKEVDVGLAADVGTLQRMPKIVGNESLVRELAFSARKMYSAEALKCGLVSRIFPDQESLVTGAVEIASTIASKSPVAVQTSKLALIHARDHSVQEGLDFIATLNMTMLQSDDVRLAAMASMSKEVPKFSKL